MHFVRTVGPSARIERRPENDRKSITGRLFGIISGYLRYWIFIVDTNLTAIAWFAQNLKQS